MKSKKSFKRPFWRSLFFLSFLFLLCGQVMFFAPSSFASDEICASVLEIEGVVESKMPDGKSRLLGPGDFVKLGEELNLSEKSWVVLTMADSTVRKFNGPAIITLKRDIPQTGGNVLARLGSAVLGVLFSQEKRRPEVAMTTRRVESPQESQDHFPLLVHPAPGSSLLEKPTEFRWRKVEGIPLYRVSVYSSDRLLWQGTTSDFHIDCPSEHCDFTPGELYYWVAEGLIGNSTLRSTAADFKVLPEDVRSELYTALREADSSCPDPELSTLIKVRLCLNLNLYDRALKLFEDHWKGKSLDRRAYLLRAEVKEKMGLFEDAFSDYKSASSMSSIK